MAEFWLLEAVDVDIVFIDSENDNDDEIVKVCKDGRVYNENDEQIGTTDPDTLREYEEGSGDGDINETFS